MMIVAAGVLVVALAFFISILATPLAARVAVRFGMMDVPQRHKAHARVTPLLGGCAIFAAILGPSLLVLALARVWSHGGAPWWMPEEVAIYIDGAASKAPMGLGILAGAFLLHVVGIIDDKVALGPWSKLLAQVLISAAVVVFCNVRVLTMAGPTISITLSILWIVAIINAFNFMDNMDGLAAGVAAICAAALLGATASVGQVFVSGWLMLLLGSLAGFLVYNFPPAKIFMGDAGSLVIGYMMGVLSCLATYVPGPSYHLYSVLVPVVLLAVPLYDTASVIYLRLKERRNPMVGDRRHFSHRLARKGMSVRSTVLTIYLCTLATAIAATMLPRVDNLGAALILVQALSILAVVALMESSET